MVIEDSVPIISAALGLPRDVVERAVRHTFRCENNPCEVEEFINQRMLQAASRNSGLPQEKLLELIVSVSKSAGDTLALREKMGERPTPEQVREVYRRGREAAEAGMRLMMEGQQ
jgi:hypothetical protein